MKYKLTHAQSLLDALSEYFPNCSKTTLRAWLKEGRVSVNGTICKKGSDLIKEDQEIEVLSKPQISKEGIEILYVDAHIVVIHKPSGLLSVAAAFDKEKTAHAFLKKMYTHVYPVHRLDQDTSGVLLFALTKKACDKLKISFEKHAIEREYIAIVEGEMSQAKGVWENYLYEDENYFVHATDDPQKGKIATTLFWTIDKTKRYSVLRLKLKTGRKNQIRVQCQLAGHPIVGDKKYGGMVNPIKRLCLHAHLLEFAHPITGKKMRFEVPAPDSFQKIMTTK